MTNDTKRASVDQPVCGEMMIDSRPCGAPPEHPAHDTSRGHRAHRFAPASPDPLPVDECAECGHVHTAGLNTRCLVINCSCGWPDPRPVERATVLIGEGPRIAAMANLLTDPLPVERCSHKWNRVCANVLSCPMHPDPIPSERVERVAKIVRQLGAAGLLAVSENPSVNLANANQTFAIIDAALADASTAPRATTNRVELVTADHISAAAQHAAQRAEPEIDVQPIGHGQPCQNATMGCPICEVLADEQDKLTDAPRMCLRCGHEEAQEERETYCRPDSVPHLYPSSLACPRCEQPIRERGEHYTFAEGFSCYTEPQPLPPMYRDEEERKAVMAYRATPAGLESDAWLRERQATIRPHRASCDEYHAHTAPKCCSETCWCRLADASTAQRAERSIDYEGIADAVTTIARAYFGWPLDHEAQRDALHDEIASALRRLLPASTGGSNGSD